jgi:hypothetical protein
LLITGNVTVPAAGGATVLVYKTPDEPTNVSLYFMASNAETD